MDEFVTRIREDQWANIIGECNNRKPGMTKRAWCELNGINIKSFYYHQRRLRNKVAHEASYSICNNNTSGLIPVSAAFADITEHVSSQQASDTPASDHGSHAQSIAPELMIQTGNYKIFVASSVNENTLEKVLRVIGHA